VPPSGVKRAFIPPNTLNPSMTTTLTSWGDCIEIIEFIEFISFYLACLGGEGKLPKSAELLA